ncbi:MAG: hypothetical protein JXB47_20570 [Anaerolineae bacterium]|nr:hypothetical protein [Anaerolineae bacterium]
MSDELHASSDNIVLRRLGALSLGAAALGVVSLPAALSSAEASFASALFATAGIIFGGAAWLLAPRRPAWARALLVFGLGVVLAVAALATTAQPAAWVGVIYALGMLSPAAVILWDRARLWQWLAGELAVWGLTVLLSQGALPLPAVTLALVGLLAANGLTGLLAGAPALRQVEPVRAAGAPAARTDHDKPLAEQVRQAVKELNRAAGTIQNVMMEQYSEADRQSGVLTNVMQTLDTFQQSVVQIGRLSQNMTTVSEDAVERANNGREIAAGAILTLEHIRSQVKSVALNLATLARHIENISEIISSLSDLATQSNFLALNASIEAARAGQHGRGFAVVADQIRDLAQQSAASAEQVRTILTEIRQAVHQTAIATDAGADGVDTGVARVTDTAQAVGHISRHVMDSTSKAQQIGNMLEAQAADLYEVNAAVKSINEMQMQYLANTRMAEAIAENLLKLAQRLEQAVTETDDEKPDSQPDLELRQEVQS